MFISIVCLGRYLPNIGWIFSERTADCKNWIVLMIPYPFASCMTLKFTIACRTVFLRIISISNRDFTCCRKIFKQSTGLALWIVSRMLVIFFLSRFKGVYCIISRGGFLFLPSRASFPIILIVSMFV